VAGPAQSEGGGGGGGAAVMLAPHRGQKWASSLVTVPQLAHLGIASLV
jgi:hypothetical protein